MPTPLLSRLSIRALAPALLALPVLIAAVVLIAIGASQSRAAVERLASQQLAQIHDQIGQHVGSLVGLPARVDQANVALIRSGRFDTRTPRGWGPALIEQFRAFESLSAITWGGEDGQCTWVARYLGDDANLYYAIKDGETGDLIVEHTVDAVGRVSESPAGSFEFDPRRRPWYIAPREAGRPAWSKPFVWVGGGAGAQQATLGLAFGWPVYDDAGGLVGVMDADLSLQDISRYLAGLTIGRTGRAFIVDDAGLLLATSTGAALVGPEGGRIAAAESDAAWIRGAAAHLGRSFGAAGGVSEDFEAVFDAGGVREWLRASPFRHGTGLRWVVVTMVPDSDFTAEIAAGRRRSAWFAAGATLATVGLGVVAASMLVRPILRLSRHVRALGEGDLEREISLPYASELARLSDDINRMAADLRDRLVLRRSLALAMEVQQNLLPSAPPRVAGLDIAGHSTYCDETGGDYYDYLEIADLSSGAAAVAVGDVMGHGIAAAMLMATARGILRSRCTESGSLGELLGHLNDLLVEVTGGVRFMTMALVTVDGVRGELRMSSAGHDPPFIFAPDGDRFIELDSGGLPLGILAGQEYPEATHAPLPVGAVVLVSTDGVWEAQDDADEQFGKERLREAIRANAGRPAREIAAAVLDEVRRFCGEARQLDDITFVVIKRTGPGAASA